MRRVKDNLIDVKLIGDCNSNISWVKEITFKVPMDLLEKYCSRTNGDIVFKWKDGNCRLNIDAIPEMEKLEIISYLKNLGMFTESPPLSSRIPFSYQLVPQFLRNYIAYTIGGGKRYNVDQWAEFPIFPLDLTVDALSDIFNIKYRKSEHTPVILTHDIDSSEALKNLYMFLLEEEKVGARSTNFIVPFKWKIDHEVLLDIKQRGHEIGIHGFDHGNKTPFLKESVINERVEKMHNFIERYGVLGYRSPSLLRTHRLFRVLSRFFRYDSSIPTSGGVFPVPNNGCASARIFQVEGTYEIPISMPRDAALLFYRYKPFEIKEICIRCADIIRKSGGVITLLTHCEKRFIKNGAMLLIYREFLNYLKNDGRYIFKTCEEIIMGN